MDFTYAPSAYSRYAVHRNLQAVATCGAVQEERLVMRLYALLQLSQRQKKQLASRWRSWKSRRAALSRCLAAEQHALDENLPTDCTANLSHLLGMVDSVLCPGCDSAGLECFLSKLNIDFESQVRIPFIFVCFSAGTPGTRPRALACAHPRHAVPIRAAETPRVLQQ